VHPTSSASLPLLDDDEDEPWVFVEFEAVPVPEVTPEDVPPPPDPKERPGGATGGVLQRVLRELDEAGKETKARDVERRRKDGLVWRIRSAL
jgi:hypothetical protein